AAGADHLAMDDLVPHLDLDARPDGAGVAPLAVALEHQANPVVARAAVVAKQPCWSAIACQHYIERAVAVDVGVGRAAADHRLEQGLASVSGLDLLEGALLVQASVPEKLRRLSVALPRLRLGDLRLEVAIGRQQVEAAVQVVVEEEGAELQRRAGRTIE